MPYSLTHTTNPVACLTLDTFCLGREGVEHRPIHHASFVAPKRTTRL